MPTSLSCEAPVMFFGATSGTTVTAAREPGREDLAERFSAFVRRLCNGRADFLAVTEGGDRLRDRLDSIVEQIGRAPKAIAILHFPYADIESGSGVDDLLSAYRAILDACRRSDSTCILGGQQPIASASPEMTARQIELERRAAAEFGAAYLPLYRHLQSRWESRRLMTSIDSGDGRGLNVFGNQLVFRLYSRVLLQSAPVDAPGRPRQPVSGSAPPVR